MQNKTKKRSYKISTSTAPMLVGAHNIFDTVDGSEIPNWCRILSINSDIIFIQNGFIAHPCQAQALDFPLFCPHS